MNHTTIISKLEQKREQIERSDMRGEDLRHQRNELWQKARDAGLTAEVIAKASGVNRSRVHQVIGTPRQKAEA